MDNRKRILGLNKLLLSFKEQIIENPNSIHNILSSNNIYYYVVRCNTPERVDNSDLFDYWIHNNNRRNTHVFVSPSWRYFCQFISQNDKMRDTTKHHKIYLSLKPEYMRDGVDRIFDFMSKHNIPHVSKIGKMSRDDQIVIRVGSHEDCLKVLDFISNDEYIQRGKKEASPIAFQHNGIALASDGNVSYSNSVTCIIRAYLTEMVNTNRINNININTFVEFCTNYYSRYFVNKENLTALFEDFDVSYGEDELYKLVDYQYCIKLFLSSLSNNFDINKYHNLIGEKIENFDIELREYEYEFNKNRYLSLFEEICRTMIGKNGYDVGSYQIKNFFATFDSSYITRDNGLRYRVENKRFYDFIIEYVRRNNTSIDEMINSYYIDNNLMFNEENKDELLKKGIITTYLYHQKLYEEGSDEHTGLEYAKAALILLIKEKIYDGFTRTDSIRRKVRENITREDAIQIIKDELGITSFEDEELYTVIDDYLKIIFDENRKNK